MGKLYKNTIIKNNDVALEEWQCDESEHPYKFAPTKTSGNAVPFPAIEKCNNYIMRHFASSIVDDIKERIVWIWRRCWCLEKHGGEDA